MSGSGKNEQERSTLQSCKSTARKCARKCGAIRPIVVFHSSGQGHPTTVFCKISVRRNKFCLEFSFTWLDFLDDHSRFFFMYNFRSSSNLANKFPTIFWSLIFHISLPGLGYFSFFFQKQLYWTYTRTVDIRWKGVWWYQGHPMTIFGKYLFGRRFAT